MVDRTTVRHVFGGLMKNPQFLSQIDKYELTPDDFFYQFDKYIFIAIDTLYRNGASLIRPVDIENFLQMSEKAKIYLKQQNGLNFLIDAEQLADIESFDYYYTKLKKLNLLTNLKDKGFDISEFYVEEPLSDKALKINENFEKLELSEIIDKTKQKLSLIESKYVKHADISTCNASDSIRDRISQYGSIENIGLPINGDCISKAINGAVLGRLTIRSGSTGTFKTRYAIGDACKFAFPYMYDNELCEWVINGYNEQVLFVCTEQQIVEVQDMVIAYLSGVNQDKFRYGNFSRNELKRLNTAVQIVEDYPNLHILCIPNPSVKLVKTLIREQAILFNIKYCFFDYIFASGNLYREFGSNNLRTDEALLLLSTALKDIAVELNISMFSATQLNAKGDDNSEIRNESALRGARSIADKVDNGMIIARPTKEELEIIKQEGWEMPNRVIDVYKTRSSPWNQIRIWSYFDGGTCRNKDLFVTNSRMEIVEDFFKDDYNIQWEAPQEILDYLKGINK